VEGVAITTTCNFAVVLAGVFLAGCAGAQPANSGPAKGNQVAPAQGPVYIQGRSASKAELNGFPALGSAGLAVAQCGVYRVEVGSDHKAYLSYGTTDRVFIWDYSKAAMMLSVIKSASESSVKSTTGSSAMGSAASDMVDLYCPWSAITELSQLLISNMQSSDPILPLVDLAKQWTSKGSITWQQRTAKLAQFAEARLSADMRERLRREIEEYSKRDELSQTQPVR